MRAVPNDETLKGPLPRLAHPPMRAVASDETLKLQLGADMCTLATAATQADECRVEAHGSDEFKLMGIRQSLVVDVELTVRMPFPAPLCPFMPLSAPHLLTALALVLCDMTSTPLI